MLGGVKRLRHRHTCLMHKVVLISESWFNIDNISIGKNYISKLHLLVMLWTNLTANDMDLEVIDRRTNRHGRTLTAEVQTDLYVKDKTMNIKFQKIASQKHIKNALKAALDFTQEELDTFTGAIEELQSLVTTDSASFFMEFDTNNDDKVSLAELKTGLKKKVEP